MTHADAKRAGRRPAATAMGRLPGRPGGPTWPSALLVLVATGTALAGQSSPRLVQPGAPGEPTREISAAEAVDLSRVRHTEADVRFTQMMLAHHAQALEMTALVDARTADDRVRRLARRIERSQSDEMDFMRTWLAGRGESADPPGHAHHEGHAMAGMLSQQQLEELAAVSGRAFDRLFLEYMIEHHRGALAMVADLLATRGAAQRSELFAFVSDVDADQRMEIGRMRAMLDEEAR